MHFRHVVTLLGQYVNLTFFNPFFFNNYPMPMSLPALKSELQY